MHDGGQLRIAAKPHPSPQFAPFLDPVVGKPLQQAADGDAPFEPCKRQPDANMRPPGKGQVAVRLAGDIEPLRVVENGRVAVGCARNMNAAIKTIFKATTLKPS